MERIRLPEGAREIVRQGRISEAEYQREKECFYQDAKDFFQRWGERENRQRWALEFLVRLAVEVYEEYKARNIADEVFDDTFYDITLWSLDNYEKRGEYGIEELGWIGNSARLEVFRLGRQMFQPIILWEDLVGEKETVPAGTPVINVHIPAGESLFPEKCQVSYDKADAFFEHKYDVYMCYSWLLSPALQEILPFGSNILEFQNKFEVVKVDNSIHQAEERIFGRVCEKKEEYPEDTLLKKRAREYLMSGGTIGLGAGFFRRSKI